MMRIIIGVLFLLPATFCHALCLEVCRDVVNEGQWQVYIQKNKALTDVLQEVHSLREQRDLPNSMARSSPKSDVPDKLNAQIILLKEKNSCDVKKKLSCMFSQRYDESLLRTSIEIALRLPVPSKVLQKWVSKLPRTERNERLALIEEVKEAIAAQPVTY